MLKIGFDLDGVISLTDQAGLVILAEQGWLTEKLPDDITDYFWENAFPGELTGEQVHWLFTESDVYQRSQPCRFLRETMTQLRRSRVELQIVTARYGGPKVREETIEWLDKHQIPYDKLVWIEATSKQDYAVQAGLHYFVEDRFDTAQRVARCGIPVFLVERPYNCPERIGEPLERLVCRANRDQFPHRIQQWARTHGIAAQDPAAFE